jgi:hypothetical protein
VKSLVIFPEAKVAIMSSLMGNYATVLCQGNITNLPKGTWRCCGRVGVDMDDNVDVWLCCKMTALNTMKLNSYT